MQRTFFQVLNQTTGVGLIHHMETVGPLADVLSLHGVALLLKIADILVHLVQLTIMDLGAHLPLLQRVVLRRAHGMAHTVDGHFDGARLADYQQGLDTQAVVIVEQDLVHLHRVFREMELTVLDLHRIHILCCLGTIERNDEDTLAFILLSVYHTFNMEFPIISLLTAVKHRYSCQSHQTQ